MMRRNMSLAAKLTAAGLSACIALQPAAVLAESVSEQVTEAAFDEWEVLSEDRNLALTVTGSVEGDDAEMVNTILEGGALKLLLSTKEGSALFNALLQENGVNLFTFLAGGDDEKLYFSFPDVNGDCYELETAPLLEQLMDTVNTTVTVKGQALPEEIDPAAEAERLLEVALPYLNVLEGMLTDTTVIEEDVQIPLTQIDGNAEGYMVTVAPTGAQLSELVNTYAEMIREDEALAELTSDWADILEQIYEAQGTVENVLTGDGAAVNEEEPDGDMQTSEGVTLEEIEAMRSFTEYAPEGLEELGRDLTELQDTVVFTSTYGRTEEGLVLIDLMLDNAEYPNVTEEMRSVFNVHYENYAGKLYFHVLVDDMDCVFSGTYNIAEDALAGEFVLSLYGMDVANLAYEFDLTRKSALGIPYGQILADLDYISAQLFIQEGRESGDDHIVTVSLGDMAEGISAVTVTVNSNTEQEAAAPSGNVVNITDYTQDELTDLGTTLAEGIIGQFMSGIRTAFGDETES